MGRENETDILKDICEKHNIKEHQLTYLLSIEKEYADKNNMRRRGMKEKIRDAITRWVEEE